MFDSRPIRPRPSRGLTAAPSNSPPVDGSHRICRNPDVSPYLVWGRGADPSRDPALTGPDGTERFLTGRAASPAGVRAANEGHGAQGTFEAPWWQQEGVNISAQRQVRNRLLQNR